MPLPSQSRHQRWSTGKAGTHIPRNKTVTEATTPFLRKRREILEHDLWKCHVCGGYGMLIDLTCDRCICRWCLP